MTWQHFQAFFWLRSRLLVNQWRRAGTLNGVLMMIIAASAVLVSIPLFIGCFALGYFTFPAAKPEHLLYVWDGLIVAFLFLWTIGLLTDLQRTESLSLSKFLHLPVSITGAFLINYASSLLRLSLIVFLPVVLGLSLALMFTKGILLLVALPSLAAFLLMVTALTYQFQGWLASLMSNPRRRRNVVMIATLVFILLSQTPNLLNMLGVWGWRRQTDESAAMSRELADLEREFQAQQIDPQERLQRRQAIINTHAEARIQAAQDATHDAQRIAELANLALPIGWLPLGVKAAAEGNVVPGIFGCLGMTLIGAASLWRAHRTTLCLYQGAFTAGQGRTSLSTVKSPTDRKVGVLIVERRLPGLSEPVSAIALAGCRSLIRAPESKMMLLTPIVLGAIFGSLLFRGTQHLPVSVRPLLGFAAFILVLFGLLQLMANQFGFDREGFRVFVLCSVPRRDILLGKNLAFVPLALGMAVILLSTVQVACPLRVDHLLAMYPQAVSMYLLLCPLANLLSIYTPMAVSGGSMKPANPKLLPVLAQMLMICLIFPLAQAPTLLPLGVEALLEHLGWTAGFPICLLLTLAECAMVIWLYRLLLNWQGRLLQSREQKILETVTSRAA